MEQFIVSARKYRPTTFKDVVGQQAITNTLENAIKNNHLAQALLFTGPRGVGKTTCARILAKRINQDGTEKEGEDFAFNIFELDAASNNSVDDIRNLIEQVRIPPQVGRYKVYIIDEVHMLSSAAFNAFLKTLEEPPKHAIFILATTEKHKIIPTILSRCQIFDFRRITVLDTKNHLAEVAKAEGINADDDALHIIAQKADGALRDALSTFDRVVSFSGKNLTREAVTENLNVLDYTWYFQITDLLLENNIPQVLMTYNDILSKGFDGHHFIMGLASHFRDLMVSLNKETIALLEVGDQVKEMYLKQSQATSATFLLEALDIANSCDLKYKSSQNQRLLVELCLMQLASLTLRGEKKNDGHHLKGCETPFILPASHFKDQKTISPPENEVDLPQEAQVEKEIPKTAPSKVETLKAIKKIQEDKVEKVPATRKVSALSLASIKKQQELKEHLANQKPAEEKELPNENFSDEALQKAWDEYADSVAAKGKHIIFSHLKMEKPRVQGHTLHLTYPNQTIKAELEREQHHLLKYLRNRLSNHKIDLEITVNETVEKKYVYHPREIFDLLKEKNPALERLRREFDLDF